jgi:hypothetical protein
MNKDIFICHASEDKPAVARPLVFELEKQGISCWLDEAEIAWGESISEKINDGLKSSKYVIVILSRAFLSKNWPKKELWAVLNIEARTGNVVVLPVLVGSTTDINYFLSEFPLLNDKRHLVWDGAPQLIVQEFLRLTEDAGLPRSQLSDLLICDQCRTSFERGVHVCLGCKGNIVYGLTDDECLDKLKRGIYLTASIWMVILYFVPVFLRNIFGFEVPDFYGLNLLFCIPAAAMICFISGFVYELKEAKKNQNLVRTFR